MSVERPIPEKAHEVVRRIVGATTATMILDALQAEGYMLIETNDREKAAREVGEAWRIARERYGWTRDKDEDT